MNGIQALAQEDVNDGVTPETIAVVEQDTTSEDEVLGNGSGQESSDEVQETSNGISVNENTETTTTEDEVKVVEEVTTGSNSKQTTDKTASTKTTTTIKTTKTATTTYTKAQLRLMSALIYCEARGECFAGKKAVGIIVINRKQSKSFPSTIKKVIYQKYQFGPASNGTLKRALARYDAGKFTSTAEKSCIRAAKQALKNQKTVTYKGKTINLKNYYFFSGKVQKYRVQIGNHQFK